MQINLNQRSIGSVLAAFLLLSITAVAAPPPGKGGGNGGGNGGGDGDGGTSDPPAAPVSYVLDTVPVEGYYPFPFSANSYGELLYGVTVAEVTQQAVNTDAYRTAAIVDISTGQVTYIDNLLTEPTMWTMLREGVEAVRFNPTKINDHGDVVGVAVETVNGEEQLPIGFLLKRTLNEAGGVAYQPISLGVSAPYFLNDFGEIFGDDLTGTFIRYTDGSKIYLEDLGLPLPPGNTYGMNNAGIAFAATITDSEIGRLDFLLDIYTLEITYVDEFIWVSGWQTQSLNNSGVAAGAKRVFYEVKERGKIRRRSYRIPAVVDPEFGLLSYDNAQRFDFARVTLNNQRFNGESAILSNTDSGDGTRQVWLKLPNTAPFFLHDALSAGDQEVWQTITNGKDFGQILTPLQEDGSVDHVARPTIVGPWVTGMVDGQWVSPGFWVLRPAE